MQSISSPTALWERMSTRERVLAGAVGLCVVVFVVTFAARTALTNISELDARIDGLQQRIIEYKFQIAQRQIVEAEYEKVAAQHSSEWTEAEISDRMSAEIRRLSLKFPPPLNAEGKPVVTQNEHGYLVDVPGLNEGVLTMGEGYREYTTKVNLPPDNLGDVLTYLERLQNSPQSLRIDELELNRAPMGTPVTARITITRTVVDRDSAMDDVEVHPEPVTETGAWVAEGCTLSGKEDGPAVTATADRDGALIYHEVDLPAGAVYECQLVAATKGAAWLAMTDDEGDSMLEGAFSFLDDGEPQRYKVQFVAPGRKGTRTRMRLPMITMVNAGEQVALRGFRLLKVAG